MEVEAAVVLAGERGCVLMCGSSLSALGTDAERLFVMLVWVEEGRVGLLRFSPGSGRSSWGCGCVCACVGVMLFLSYLPSALSCETERGGGMR